MTLSYDIILDDCAFSIASTDMTVLKSDTENLKIKLETMFQVLSTAMDTPAGKQLTLTAGDVLIKPIDDMILVLTHISSTLTEIIGSGYYKNVFIKFEELNQSII